MKIHYSNNGQVLCQTRNANRTTDNPQQTNCKVCRFHLGLYKPDNYNPEQIRQTNQELLTKAAKRAIDKLIKALVINCHLQGSNWHQ